MRYEVSNTPTLISADQTSASKVVNSGATVYYKSSSDVSSSSNDGSIASGATLLLTTPKWFACATGSVTTIDTVDVDGFGFEFTQPGAPISNEAIAYLSTLAGTTGALTGTSLSVTGDVASNTVTTGALTSNTGVFSALLSANAGLEVAAALTGPVYKSRQVAINRVLSNKLLNADANYALEIYGDGKIQWGSGGATAVDTNLYRSAADTLKTDDSLVVTGTLASAAQTLTTATLSGTGKTAISLSDATTTTGLTIGTDTNLYRNAADTLKTDDSLIVTGTLTAGTFAPSALSIAGTGKTAITLSDTTTTTGLTIGADTNLYRNAADTLKTDDALIVTGALTSGAQTLTTETLSGTGKTAISFSDTTTTTGLTIGADTNLYRNAADTLKTDDGFIVGGSLTVVGAITGPAVVSALPGSPVDGQECYYQNAAMATAGIVWHLRYRAGGGTYKWECIGCAPLTHSVATIETTASATYVALTTPGPSIAVPLAGNYVVSHGYLVQPGNPAAVSYMSYDIGGTGAVDADSVQGYTSSGVSQFSVSKTWPKTGLTAVTLTAKYKSSTGTNTYSARWMTLTPQCVG